MQELAWVWVLIGWFFHVSSINFEKASIKTFSV